MQRTINILLFWVQDSNRGESHALLLHRRLSYPLKERIKDHYVAVRDGRRELMRIRTSRRRGRIRTDDINIVSPIAPRLDFVSALLIVLFYTPL